MNMKWKKIFDKPIRNFGNSNSERYTATYGMYLNGELQYRIQGMIGNWAKPLGLPSSEAPRTLWFVYDKLGLDITDELRPCSPITKLSDAKDFAEGYLEETVVGG